MSTARRHQDLVKGVGEKEGKRPQGGGERKGRPQTIDSTGRKMNDEARLGDEEAWEEEEYEWGQEDEDEEDELDGDWYGDFSVPAATGGKTKTKTKKKKAKGLAGVRPLPARSASKVLEQHELAAVVAEWRMASRRSSAIDPKGCQEVLTLALAFLKQRYANHFPATTSPTPTPTSKKIMAHVALEKVDLVFARGGTEIQCQPATGKIEFGMETIKKEFYDGASSRYLLENDFMPKVQPNQIFE